MTFSEKTTVGLADKTARLTVLSSGHLERILNVAYKTSEMPLSGPFTAIFDEFRFGFEATPASMVDGWVGLPATAGSNPLSFRVEGLGQIGSIAPDAIWRGAIVARTVLSQAPVESVGFRWLLDDIDLQITARLGALPSGATLEAERRAQLIDNAKAASALPDSVTEERLDDWLSNLGAQSLGAVIEGQRSSLALGVAQVTYKDVSVGPPLPRQLPVAVALLIRDEGLSVRSLLKESAAVRKSLSNQGIEVALDEAARPRFSIVVAWILPKTIFTDTDWPGNSDADREARAAGWLAEQGIALVAI